MTNILILGANGQIARVATHPVPRPPGRQPDPLPAQPPPPKGRHPSSRVRVVEGDVLDQKALEAAMAGQRRCLCKPRRGIGTARPLHRRRHAEDRLQRLDLHQFNGNLRRSPRRAPWHYPQPHRKSAGIIEASGLDYTIIRPAWLNNRDEINYATTNKGQPFENAPEQVSRKSVADLVVKLATTPGLEIRSSLGVHKAPTN